MAAQETAVEGVILRPRLSHLQISLRCLADAIYGPHAHAAAWLRMRQGLGEPRGEEGRVREGRGGVRSTGLPSLERIALRSACILLLMAGFGVVRGRAAGS